MQLLFWSRYRSIADGVGSYSRWGYGGTRARRKDSLGACYGARAYRGSVPPTSYRLIVLRTGTDVGYPATRLLRDVRY
eukprot:3339657-Rhodomonas_salina.1